MNRTAEPQRDVPVSAFGEILAAFDTVVPGLEAVVFFDDEGETIDYHSYLDPFDTRLLGAHLAVVIQGALRRLRPERWGGVRRLLCHTTHKDILVVVVDEGLFLAVMVRAGSLSSLVERRLQVVIDRLLAEVG